MNNYTIHLKSNIFSCFASSHTKSLPWFVSSHTKRLPWFVSSQTKLLILSIFTVFLLQNCANRVSPTGGPKDTLAPFIVRTIPLNQSVNYRGNTVVLEFDEWIKEKNLQRELLIIPKIKDYTFKITKTRLEIKIKDTLRENTTYSFNFRKGIADITESNIALKDTIKKESLKLAFSTGATIDTMSVNGKVLDFFTNKAVKETTIALYKIDDTLKINKHTPYYFTLTDEKGLFDIQNIQVGQYQIYAFADKNNDAIYQEPELIGFVEKPLSFADSTSALSDISLKIASEDHKAPEILYQRTIAADFDVEFSEGLQSYQVEVLNPEQSKSIAFNLSTQEKDKGKVLKFYNLEAIADSIPLKITAIDSVGNQMTKETKIAFKIEKEKEDDKRPRRNRTQTTSKPFNFEVKLPTGTAFEKALRLDLVFEKPVKTFDFSKITYLADKDTLKRIQLIYADTTKDFQWNQAKSMLSINKKINFKEKMTLFIDSLAFVSIQNDTSKAFKSTYNIKNIDNFGSISGKIKTEQSHFVIQLVNESNQVIAESKNGKMYNFQYLPAGTYKLRVIIDRNQNGKWDSSDVLKNIPAEEILFFELPANGKLKEKWDIEGDEIVF